MTSPEEALRRGWGYGSFRPLQKEAVAAALAGRDCLVVAPTGGGKSLCYQLPAAMGHGLVLVVSPLIALMDDQVGAAREAGLAADALHSNLESDHRGEAYRRLAAGETQLLYVSPERLLVGDLLEDLAPRLILAAVDEAHCVSHWGHEFRPEYRRLAEVLERFPKAARMALTATATPAVQDDICSQLALREPEKLIGHPDRPNLVYRAFARRDQLPQVLEVVRRHEGSGGIVYAQTRKDVERIAAGLKKAGVSCAPYHAGLAADLRRRAQEDFVGERIDVVCATIAFGMGIDRSNVRYVVHANTPRSVEHYQQESGRAGRDGAEAECVLLFAASDLALHRWLAQKSRVTPERAKALERQLKEIGRYAVSPVCRHRLLAEHFGAEALSESCGACDVCLGETKGLAEDEARLTAEKILGAALRSQGRYGTGTVVNHLLGKDEKRMPGGGELAAAGEAAVRSWIDQLIVQGMLEVTDDGLYPLLRITQAGRDYCGGSGSVRLGAAIASKGRASRKAKSGTATTREAPADRGLFERLRALRKLLAAQKGVAPYMVFHDAALLEMAERKPKTLEALSGIKGVGDFKLKRYGPAFLKEIAGAS